MSVKQLGIQYKHLSGNNSRDLTLDYEIYLNKRVMVWSGLR